MGRSKNKSKPEKEQAGLLHRRQACYHSTASAKPTATQQRTPAVAVHSILIYAQQTEGRLVRLSGSARTIAGHISWQQNSTSRFGTDRLPPQHEAKNEQQRGGGNYA